MRAIQEFQSKKNAYVEELFELLRIPSISYDRGSVRQAADWLVQHLQQTADSVELVETSGNPVVLAEWNPQTEHESNQPVPTLLVYGHYDVQPPDPLDEWISPPFEPEIRDRRIFARGAGDNKGQFFAHLCAIECVHKLGQLGLKVKCILDGEEELASPHLNEALHAKEAFFKDVDLIIVSDGSVSPSGQPEICFGVRGIVAARLELQVANEDVHSGKLGGIQPNPVWDMISILHTMRDETGRCLIEGFYDDVFTPEPDALEAANQLGKDPKAYKQQLGISYFGGEQEQPLLHRVMFRPTCNIRGIQAGSVREQARTIIPKEVVVELDMRLVPYQKPDTIQSLLQTHLDRLRQRSERWAAVIDRCKVSFEANFHPMYTPLHLPWTDVLVSAIQDGFGQDPVKIPLAGGSLPLYDLYEVTGKPLYAIPYGQPDESNHAPNENLMLEWFENGVRTSIQLLHKLARQC